MDGLVVKSGELSQSRLSSRLADIGQPMQPLWAPGPHGESVEAKRWSESSDPSSHESPLPWAPAPESDLQGETQAPSPGVPPAAVPEDGFAA